MAYELTQEIRVSVDGGCTVTTYAAGTHDELPEPAIVYAESVKALKTGGGGKKATSAPKNKAEPAPENNKA